MIRGVATALAVMLASIAVPPAAFAQGPVQCSSFQQLRADAEQRATAVKNAIARKAERKDVCVLMQHFYAAEGAVLKFLEDNKTWCGVPEQAVAMAKKSHERTGQFRTAACTEAPVAKPRAPSLSDSINTPSVDTGNNTKTGRGTLDSLNGNPLAK
jgi:hypothetical protein